MHTAVFKVFQSEYIKSARRFTGAAEKESQCKEVCRSVRYMRDTGRSGCFIEKITIFSLYRFSVFRQLIIFDP